MALDIEIRKFRYASAEFQKHIRRHSAEETVIRISQLFRLVEKDMDLQRLYPLNELYKVMKWAIAQHDRVYPIPKELSEKSLRILIEEAKNLIGPQLDT